MLAIRWHLCGVLCVLDVAQSRTSDPADKPDIGWAGLVPRRRPSIPTADGSTTLEATGY